MSLAYTALISENRQLVKMRKINIVFHKSSKCFLFEQTLRRLIFAQNSISDEV